MAKTYEDGVNDFAEFLSERLDGEYDIDVSDMRDYFLQHLDEETDPDGDCTDEWNRYYNDTRL